jgi:hypothetical protein
MQISWEEHKVESTIADFAKLHRRKSEMTLIRVIIILCEEYFIGSPSIVTRTAP